MKRTIIGLITVAALALAVCSMAKQPQSVATIRPSVVKTAPQCGDTKVDPALKEIRITFSKDMTDGNWSWCTADEGAFPKMDGSPKYLADKRTCVLTVELKPKTTYAIWLSTHKFTNFKDKDKRSAVPYLLVFETE